MSTISASLLLALLGDKEVVAYRPKLARALGSPGAALFLCQAIYWQQVAGEGKFFFKNRDAERDENKKMLPPSSANKQSWEWELGGMGRAEQESARRLLKEKGLLEEELSGIPARLHFRVNLAKIAEFVHNNQQYVEIPPTGWLESHQLDGGKSTNWLVENPPTNTETTPEITSQTTSKNKKSLVDLAIDDIFSYWKSTMNHRGAKLDSTRRKIIAARLRDGYTSPDLKLAIDGCRLSPFHMGQNDQTVVYDGIEVIFKSADNVDKFIALASRKPMMAGGALGSSLSLAERAALMDWGDDDEIAA